MNMVNTVNAVNTVMSLLKARGLRPTMARLQLLSVLEQAAGERLSAEQIFMQVNGTDASLSLASVYRVLKDLSYHGLVERGWRQQGQEVRLLFALGGDPETGAQPLLQCVVCQRSMALPMPQLRDSLNTLGRAGQLQPRDGPIMVQVICPDCA